MCKCWFTDNSNKNAVAAGRRLTTHFRKSEPTLRALRSRQKDMRVLIQDISTQWNSTYYMIEHLIEQRWPITAVLSDHTVTKLVTDTLI